MWLTHEIRMCDCFLVWQAWGDIYKEIIFMSSIEHDFIIAYYGCYLSDLSVWVRPPDQTPVKQPAAIHRIPLGR